MKVGSDGVDVDVRARIPESLAREARFKRLRSAWPLRSIRRLTVCPNGNIFIYHFVDKTGSGLYFYEMESRYLGRSGLQISSLTYGNWLTHGSQIDVELAGRCVRAALDVGITSFDTADSYANGAAEEILGATLKGERREALQIMTKVFFPVGAQPWGKNDAGLSRKHIMEGIDASLRRLQLDYIDVYQAHRFDRFTPLEETIQAFADVVRAGKALYIGVSEWPVDQLRAGQALARQLGFSLVSNQTQYSMLWRVIEGDVVPTSNELGISQVVWSPLAQGVLTGKYLPGQPAPAGSRAADTSGGAEMISRWMTDEVLTPVQRIRPVAENLGLSMAQLGLAWVLSNPNVASAVIGASRPEQLAENVRSTEIVLSPETLAEIEGILGTVAITDSARTIDFTPKARPV